MDQEKAKILFDGGAFLIVEGKIPEGGIEFGIDWNTWTTGPKFQGVKMIPPGVHFVSYCSVSRSTGDRSPKSSFFHHFKAGEIMVKVWNAVDEELLDRCVSAEELVAIRANLKNLDKNLGPYPYESFRKWVSMSGLISEPIVLKLSPMHGLISSAVCLSTQKDESGKSKFGLTDASGLPVMSKNASAQIQFTSLPTHWYPEGCSSAEKTLHSMDSSYALGELLKTYPEKSDLLGELQYAFVCFVLGQVLDAFDHWREIVRILCNCEKDLNQHTSIYTKFIELLYHQLGEISADFFVDICSSNNFLVTHLTTLFASIESVSEEESLRKIAKKFRCHLTKKYKWKFNEEPEDWAPVVVET